MTFAETRVISYLGLPIPASRDLLAFLGVALFAVSVVSLRVDWKEASANHARAAESLGRLKAELRDARDVEDVRLRTSQVLSDLEPIPDRLFLSLKAKHLRKVEVSKALSRRPGIPLLLAWAEVIMRARSLREVGHGDGDGC
jgi:hypothetical protein